MKSVVIRDRWTNICCTHTPSFVSVDTNKRITWAEAKWPLVPLSGPMAYAWRSEESKLFWFGSSVSNVWRKLCAYMQAHTCCGCLLAHGGKYLGLPTHIGKSVKKCFNYLKDIIISRLQGGMERCLSTAGKEIYVKAIAQAIPTYAMACFDLT